MDRRRLLLVLLFAGGALPATAAAQGANAVLDEVEVRLRRPLTGPERRRATEAARAWSDALRALSRRFADDVARLTSLRSSQIAALVGDVADPMAVRTLGPEIEALRDRPLSPAQRQRLAALDASRRAEVAAIDRRLADGLAGLGFDEVATARLLASVRGR